MEIDWITVAAQIVNFLILVWLLQHFLYKPITQAMARREQRIADRLKEAEEARRKAEREAAQYRKQQKDFEDQRSELIRKAEQKADERRKELEQKARQAVDEKRQAWDRQIEEEQEGFLGDLRRRATEQFCALARKALADLADSELEAQIVSVLMARLKKLDEDWLKKMTEAAEKAGSIEVRSAFELAADQRRGLTRTLHDLLSSSVDVDYGQSDEIACGVEIRAGGQTLRWSLNSYLEQLEDELSSELSRRADAGRTRAEAAQ